LTAEAIYTLIILTITVVLLITEWMPHGMTGLCAIVALTVTGALTSEEAFSGLSNSAVVTVASMYVLSAAVVRTGAAAAMANQLTKPGGTGKGRAYLLLLLVTMLLSAFVNNTPLILIFLPLVLGLARQMGEAPSRLLIPLSYVSILGGSTTLIGTSTNLIVASSLHDVSGGALELGMFTFARLGVIIAVAGGLLVILLRKHVLPERSSLGLLTQKGVAIEYVTEVTVLERGGLAGRTLEEIDTESMLGQGLRILQVVRGEVIRSPSSDLKLAVGDLLLIKGEPESVLQLRLAQARRNPDHQGESIRGVGLTMFELVVTPASPWVSVRVGDLKLHDRYDASVFAVQRHGAHLRDKIDHLALQPGDVLLLQGTEDSMQRLRDVSGVLVIEGVDQIARDQGRAPRAVLSMGAFVLLAVTGTTPIEVAALAAALITVLTGCLSVRRAYESIDWNVLFVIAGTLALGLACARTGLAAQVAESVIAVAAPFGTRAVLAVILVFTALLTQVMSNNATAAVMTPIAYQLGLELNAADPLPYVMAVAFGANCSFLTPVSYNTNLIVYGPGGYRFSDFLRLGLPLTILTLVIAIILLPALY
jgi:di/tricarboxylate transporter